MNLSELLPRLDHSLHPHSAIVCFPHAGGSASYFQRWLPFLPQGYALYALQLPLREERLDAEPLDDIAELMKPLLPALQGIGLPLTLFGHSMGAILAWEAALQLSSPPRHLFVSGQTPPDSSRVTRFHQMSDRALIEEVTRFSATPAALFDFPDLRELVLAQLRHDYALIERWHPTCDCRLRAPVTVLHGREDSEVTLSEASRWSNFTAQSFRLYSWPGDHFYLTAHAQAVIQRLCEGRYLHHPEMP